MGSREPFRRDLRKPSGTPPPFFGPNSGFPKSGLGSFKQKTHTHTHKTSKPPLTPPPPTPPSPPDSPPQRARALRRPLLSHGSVRGLNATASCAAPAPPRTPSPAAHPPPPPSPEGLCRGPGGGAGGGLGGLAPRNPSRLITWKWSQNTWAVHLSFPKNPPKDGRGPRVFCR